jgi:hypothetical protein
MHGVAVRSQVAWWCAGSCVVHRRAEDAGWLVRTIARVFDANRKGRRVGSCLPTWNARLEVVLIILATSSKLFKPTSHVPNLARPPPRNVLKADIHEATGGASSSVRWLAGDTSLSTILGGGQELMPAWLEERLFTLNAGKADGGVRSLLSFMGTELVPAWLEERSRCLRTEPSPSSLLSIRFGVACHLELHRHSLRTHQHLASRRLASLLQAFKHAEQSMESVERPPKGIPMASPSSQGSAG